MVPQVEDPNAGSRAKRQSFCPLNYAPVCGVDGNTYSNDCQARGRDMVKVKMIHELGCVKSPLNPVQTIGLGQMTGPRVRECHRQGQAETARTNSTNLRPTF